MKLLFISVVLVILYTYLIYPIILFLLSKLLSAVHKNECDVPSKAELPTVAIIISAYNEEQYIEERVNNLLSLNYPKDKIKYFIGSDGSDDDTNEILSKFTDETLKFFPFKNRRGKASVLNDLIARSEEDIVVFSDANTMFDSDAVKIIASKFVNESIGGVCGELKLLSNKDHDNLDGIYWRYEKFIKSHEGMFDAIVGANGAIYAVRRKIYKSIPSDTVVDDFYVAMNVVKDGYSFKYCPKAFAYEYAPETQKQEFKRRVRIGLGNYQSFFRFLYFMNPFNSFKHFFTYFSHKVIRWLTPHLMIVLLLLNFILIKESYFDILLGMQIIVYLFSWFAFNYVNLKNIPRVVSLIVFFVTMNAALFVGFMKYISKTVTPTWERTAR